MEGAIPLEEGEILFKLEDQGDGWAEVRRERDDEVGLVPLRRLRLAPLPEMDAVESNSGEDSRPAPAVSDSEDEASPAGGDEDAATDLDSSEPATDDEVDLATLAARASNGK